MLWCFKLYYIVDCLDPNDLHMDTCIDCSSNNRNQFKRDIKGCNNKHAAEDVCCRKPNSNRMLRVSESGGFRSIFTRLWNNPHAKRKRTGFNSFLLDSKKYCIGTINEMITIMAMLCTPDNIYSYMCIVWKLHTSVLTPSDQLNHSLASHFLLLSVQNIKLLLGHGAKIKKDIVYYMLS